MKISDRAVVEEGILQLFIGGLNEGRNGTAVVGISGAGFDFFMFILPQQSEQFIENQSIVLKYVCFSDSFMSFDANMHPFSLGFEPAGSGAERGLL